jgi:hypothetical protein
VEFTRRDLIEAYIDCQRHARAAAEKRDWHMRRYHALASAFDCLLEKPGDGPAVPASWLASHETPLPFGPGIWADPNARWSLHQLFVTTVDAYRSIDTPCSRFVDIPPAVLTMHSRHGGGIDERIAELREAYMLLIEDLVEAIWGIGPDRAITAAELRRHGFDPGERAPTLV